MESGIIHHAQPADAGVLSCGRANRIGDFMLIGVEVADKGESPVNLRVTLRHDPDCLEKSQVVLALFQRGHAENSNRSAHIARRRHPSWMAAKLPRKLYW